MSKFSTFLKQPSAQGVHQTTALGNADRKRRSFNEVVAQQIVSTKRPDIEKPDTSDAEDDIVQGVKPSGARKYFKYSWRLSFEVKKADPEQRLVFGWASVAALDGERIIDKQGDIILLEDLEKAVIEYSLNSRDGGDMHSRKGVSKLIESFVFTPEKEKLGILAKDDRGRTIHGWWTGFYVHDDELWAAYKRGERPELSIGGQAFPVEVEVDKKSAAEDDALNGEVEKAKVNLDKYREKARKLVKAAEIDRKVHVLEIADRSKNGKCVYIDEHVPKYVGGVDTNVSLAWHELSEWLAMNDGMSYDDAHNNVATPLEREYVGDDKWARYQAEFDQYEHEIEDLDEADVPPDIDLRVYEGKELAFMRKAVKHED